MKQIRCKECGSYDVYSSRQEGVLLIIIGILFFWTFILSFLILIGVLKLLSPVTYRCKGCGYRFNK